MPKVDGIIRALAEEKWDRSRGYFDAEKCEHDAFVAMVALGLRVECCENGQVYVWKGKDLIWNSFAVHHDLVSERLAATRFAIDRAIRQLLEPAE